MAKAAFATAAAPFVWSAARRVARLESQLDLERLVEELRRAGRVRLPGSIENPAWLDATVARLLPFLPPRRLGPCLRRSLIVCELWSRCGLSPRLHLGVKVPLITAEAHAWVTARAHDGSELASSSPSGHAEAFVF